MQESDERGRTFANGKHAADHGPHVVFAESFELESVSGGAGQRRTELTVGLVHAVGGDDENGTIDEVGSGKLT
jgi:hypothetical protein